MSKVKFGLTAKEEKLFLKAMNLLEKADSVANSFYDSIRKRFDDAGYDGDDVIDTITEKDAYVFSSSGCSHDASIWEEIEKELKQDD